jgi:hypothetical protein
LNKPGIKFFSDVIKVKRSRDANITLSLFLKFDNDTQLEEKLVCETF